MKIKEITKKEGITLIALVIMILILLILAGITITAITGENGLLSSSLKAKEETEIENEKEIISRATAQVIAEDPRGNIEEGSLQKELNKETEEGKTEVTDVGNEFEVQFTESKRYYIVDKDGNVKEVVYEENTAEVPKYWEKTTIEDKEWYSYIDISKGESETEENKGVKVNKPKIRGAMKPIKYVGEDSETQTGSKWANAITADGSMWVWIPRYAYKITSGYHESGTETTGGTIEIAFIDTQNNFLNEETGKIVTKPEEVTYTETETGEKVQNEWLVHPAFTSNAENGGGFGEITGIWVGKFETTGEKDSSTETWKIRILPGVSSNLGVLTVNEQYKLAKGTTFGEKIKINSHMAKNSEWGVIAYLAQSKYGVNGKEIEGTGNTVAGTGGTSDEKIIYTTNKGQSTTNNAYGIYDMRGGLWESVASYVNFNYNSNDIINNGGYGEEESILGKNEKKRATSTAYKTVYESGNISYNLTEKIKGDVIWETSSNYGDYTSIWFGGYNRYPVSTNPFFGRGGNYYDFDNSNIFAFSMSNGRNLNGTFRCILAF